MLLTRDHSNHISMLHGSYLLVIIMILSTMFGEHRTKLILNLIGIFLDTLHYLEAAKIQSRGPLGYDIVKWHDINILP